MGGVCLPYNIQEIIMAQYWYKKDKRIKRISEQSDDRDVVRQVKDLKENGYIQVKDRRNLEPILPKKTPKPKPIKKKKVPKKAKLGSKK